MKVLTSHLKALLVVAPTNGIRDYLKGVFLTKHNNNLLMVATDGHRMLVINAGKTDEEFEDFVIPVELVKKALTGYKAPFSIIHIDEIFNRKITINDTIGDRIDDMFPNWRRVIPNDNYDETPSRLHCQYVADFDKICGIIGASVNYKIKQNNESTCLVNFSDPNIFGVIMSMKDAELDNKVPAWI